MAGYVSPSFDDEAPAPAAKAAPAKAAAPAPVASGYVSPSFDDEAAPAKAAAPAAKPAKKEFKDMTMPDAIDAVGDELFGVNPGKGSAMFNGLMLGMGDRIRAATGIGVEGKTYDERLNRALAEREQYNKDNPIGHYVTEGVPGLFTGAAAAKGLGALAQKVAPGLVQYAQGSGLLPASLRAGEMAGQGAAFGAISGAGSAKPGEMAKGATEGAGMGAGVALGMSGTGKLLSAAGSVMTPLVQQVAKMTGVADPNKWAERKIVEGLLANGESVESVVRKMKQMSNDGAWRPQADNFMGPPQALPAKPVVMADALPPQLLGQLKAATNKGPAADVVLGKLGQRAVEAPDRIAADIATNISDRTGASSELTRIIEDRAAKSKPLYDAALARGTLSADEVLPFFNNHVKNSLFHDVQRTKAGIGEPFQGRISVNPKTKEFEIVQTPSIADLHEMRKHLSEKKQSLWDTDKNKYEGWAKVGGLDLNSTQIDKQLKELTAHIEKLTPDGKGGSHYAEARKIFSDDSSVAEALNKGTNVIRTRPEDVAIEFSKLKSEAERDAYRAGISSVLTDKAGSTASGATILKNVFGNKNIRDKLDQVYPNNAARELFPKQMAAEQKMQDTSKILAPKVASHDFLESGGDASLPAALANFAAGRFVAGSANAARFIAGQADKMNPQYGEQLARLGMMSLPEAESFAASVARKQNNPFSKAGRAIKGGLSSLAGAMPSVGGGLAARQDEEGALSRLNSNR